MKHLLTVNNVAPRCDISHKLHRNYSYIYIVTTIHQMSLEADILQDEQVQQFDVESEQQLQDDQQLPADVNEGNIEDNEDDEILKPNDEAADDAEGNNRVEDAQDADEGAGDEDFDATNTENGNVEQDYDDEDIYSMQSHKTKEGNATRKKIIRKKTKEAPELPNFTAERPSEDIYADNDVIDYSNEDPATRKRRLLEERMTMAVKSKTVRKRKADEDDLERMQDDKIDQLKNLMIEAANLDVEKNSQGQIATEKLKLLKEVMDTLSKADLAISILDNNLLEAVRLWLEPLPDASMPAYQIQKELMQSLTTLPIKTDHLVASGIGKVLVFYQRSKRTEPNLKKIVDRLIGDWTRPILNKSDSYKDRTIRFHDYNKSKFTNKLQSLRKNKTKESKTLYEQQAERRNRAAIPSARTTAYKIAPKVDPSLLMRQQKGSGEMFNRINRKMTNSRKKVVKKSGPSIEGKNLSM